MAKLLLVQQFFPHYRDGTLKAFLEIPDTSWEFLGCSRDPDEPTIEPWNPPIGVDIEFMTPRNVFGLRWHVGLLKVVLRRYDAIIMVGTAKWPSLWLAAMLGRALGSRIIFWTHGWLAEESGVKAFLKILFYRLSHGILFYENRAKQITKKKGYSGLADVIYNSVNESTVSLCQQKERISGKNLRKRYLISCARLIKSRKYDLLFNALTELGDDAPQLVLIGDGPERSSLTALASEMRLDVIFLGAIYDVNELKKYYRDAFASVIPGRVGLSAIQSLKFGVPVVTHADGDDQHPEFEVLKDGENSFLFLKDSAPALAAALQRAKISFSPAIAANCKASIPEYSPDKQAKVLLKMLKNLEVL